MLVRDHCTHRHVQRNHREWPASAEDGRRRLRIAPDVRLRHRADVARDLARPAHDRHTADQFRQTRLEPERQREIGQRSHRHQVDLPGRPGHQSDDLLSSGACDRLDGRRRQVHVPLAVVAMDMRRVDRSATGEWPVRPARNRDRRCAGNLDQAQGVPRGDIERDIAPHAPDAHHLYVGERQRIQDRDRVVDAGVAVE